MTNTFYEATASTIEEAIESGLKELNLPRDAVQVEVIDEGSKGLFGLGSRDAIVRLTPISNNLPNPIKADSRMDVEKSELQIESGGPEDPPDDQSSNETQIGGTEDDNLLAISREIVSELIEKMHVKAEVVASYRDEEDDRRQRPSVLVEVNGEDLSILIGRQADTLNAQQYITRLIVSKEIGRGVDLQVEVHGYRARRAEQLTRIANQLAEQASRTGKRQYLEPMPSDDRRLVHIALRNHPDVYTESIGEGSRRKVTINPK
jgi:spoIIIJ-associated protein